jgi:hypothetical protein
MAKDKATQEADIITAQGQVDNAPAAGKAAYLKLPSEIKLFQPENNRVYKLVFLPWRGKKGNTSVMANGWTTNRFIYVHNNVGPGDERVICLQRTLGKPCPVCEEFARQKAAGKDWEKVLQPLKFKNRELIFVHNTAEKDSLYVWDESTFLFGDNFRLKFNKKDEWRAYADFNKGCIIEVNAVEKKMGKGSCVECGVNIEMDVRKEPLSKFLVEAAKKYCIDDYFVLPTYERIAKLLGQTGGDAEEVTEETPAAAAPEEEETPAEETPAEEPEEEEEEEEPEPEEEVEEEEPEEDAAKYKKDDKVKYKKLTCTVVNVGSDGSYKLKSPKGKIYEGVAESDCEECKK